MDQSVYSTPTMIVLALNDVLKARGKTLYWLSRNAGVPYNTLWHLAQKETQSSINLSMLFRVCAALDCTPGDILIYEDDEESRAIKSLIRTKPKTGMRGRK
jgi:putative transcriptional regulator